MSIARDFGKSTLRGICNVSAVAAREKRRVLDEMGEVRGLIPLLIKSQSQQPLTRADKVKLRRQVKRIYRLCPYLLLLVVPGGLIALPALAWWLDRRRLRASPQNAGSIIR